MFPKIKNLHSEIFQIIFALIQLPLLIAITLMNTEFLYQFDILNSYAILFYCYAIISLWGIFAIRKKIFAPYIFEQDAYYFLKSIFLLVLLTFLGALFTHFFIVEHLGQADLYLRAYGRVAFLYTTLALSISPLLIYIKKSSLREYMILLRKILGITADRKSVV